MSLYQTTRPDDFDGVFGNKQAVQILRSAVDAEDRPHTYLLYGPSGCGKTTLARIMAKKLGCDVKPEGSADYMEVNASNTRGIDDMRRIAQDASYPPITGGVRVVVIDECHAATKDAQNCLLKPLEDTPDHQYYILCTTDPHKLLKTILTRCSQVEIKPLSEDDIFAMLGRVVDVHKLPDPGDNVLDAITKRAEGCARSAMTMLEQQLGKSESEALATVNAYQSQERQGIDLCRALISKQPWRKIVSIYTKLENPEPEGLRRLLLAWLKTCMLKAKSDDEAGKFANMIAELSEPTYDCGEAGLLAMMFNAMN